MSELEGNEVVVERRIAARPETVFRFFTDQALWTMWQGIDAHIDAQPGGALRVNVTGDGHASGEFIEVVPPRRVVFTWGWESPGSPVPPGSSVVEIELLPEDGETLVRLSHRRLPGAAADAHRAGWTNYVGRLAAVSEGRDPGPDPLRSR
jgi:uncharacterized protein YndB with AHSA1/START domain